MNIKIRKESKTITKLNRSDFAMYYLLRKFNKETQSYTTDKREFVSKIIESLNSVRDTMSRFRTMTGSSSTENTYTFEYKNKRLRKTYSKSINVIGNDYTRVLAEYKKIKDYFIALVKKERADNRKINISRRESSTFTRETNIFSYEMVGDNMVGFVHQKKNDYRELYIYKQSSMVFQEKKPVTNDNHIGVEIEFFCNSDRARLGAKLYEEGLAKYVYLKYDGSIKPTSGKTGHELCILMKEDEEEINRIMHKVSSVLKSFDAQVNQSCGLHVHLDMRNRDKDKAFYNLSGVQHLLYAMNPKIRKDGTYSRKVPTRKFEEAVSMSGKYWGVNTQSYSSKRTIEIRMHSGTVEAVKIVNWIKLLCKIVNKPDKIIRSASTFKGFVNQYDIDLNLAKYIAGRVMKYNVPDDQQEIEST